MNIVGQMQGGSEVSLTSGVDSDPRFSPDGLHLVSFRKDGMKVFDARDGSLEVHLEGLLSQIEEGEVTPGIGEEGVVVIAEKREGVDVDATDLGGDGETVEEELVDRGGGTEAELASGHPSGDQIGATGNNLSRDQGDTSRGNHERDRCAGGDHRRWSGGGGAGSRGYRSGEC